MEILSCKAKLSSYFYAFLHAFPLIRKTPCVYWRNYEKLLRKLKGGMEAHPFLWLCLDSLSFHLISLPHQP